MRWESKVPNLMDTHSNFSLTTELDDVAQGDIVAWLRQSHRLLQVVY